MAKLIQIVDLLNPEQGRTVSEYCGTIGKLRNETKNKDIVIFVDGYVMKEEDNDYIPGANQVICICPDAKYLVKQSKNRFLKFE